MQVQGIHTKLSIYKELLDSFNMHAKWQVLSKKEEVSFTRKQRKKKFRKRNDGNICLVPEKNDGNIQIKVILFFACHNKCKEKRMGPIKTYKSWTLQLQTKRF